VIGHGKGSQQTVLFLGQKVTRVLLVLGVHVVEYSTVKYNIVVLLVVHILLVHRDPIENMKSFMCARLFYAAFLVRTVLE
jgi:hypothetical protein